MGIVQAEEMPFWDRTWVFPGFVKHQKLLYEEGQYRYYDEVWQAIVTDSVKPDGSSFFDYGEMLYIDKGDIYLVGFDEEIRKTTAESVWFEENGFSKIRFEEYVFDVIFGDSLVAFPAPISWKKIDTYHGRLDVVQKAQERIIHNMLNNEKTRIGIDQTFLYQPIKDVRVPSCLKETVGGEKVIYSTDFYKYRWVFEHGHVFAQMYYRDGSVPWVEAEPGDGTGISFEVDFKEPVDNIVLLNGFVDMQRKHLYKQNARMQKILISGKGFSETYHLKDRVQFQLCRFPVKVESIKVKVLSVYPGTKWDDMAISGLYVHMPYEKISEEEKQRRYRLHVDMIKKKYAQQQESRVKSEPNKEEH